MGRMTKAQRDEKSALAVDMSARGYTYVRIGEALGVDRKTAAKLIEDELASRSEHREQDKERHLASYQAIQDAAWDAFRNTDNRSLNRSGYLNTIKSCEDSKAKITGAEAPRKYQQVDDTFEIVFDDDELIEAEG